MSRRKLENSSQNEGQPKRSRGSNSAFNNEAESTSSSVFDLMRENIRSGKVLKIHLKNFMCHSNLMINFNERVNLLVGNNGSGKSAILTALVVGLGCKASATNRSSNIKQLIKHGEDYATIEIHLLNSGMDAYEQECYGDKIIVVRHITVAGVSTYKLKDENGRVIATQRNDLMKLTLYLNIQVDNPVCVLNQDAARSFLKDSDPKLQYQLFLKATQIDIILSKLEDCITYHKQAVYHLTCRKKILETLTIELEFIQDKFERLKSVKYIKTNLTSTQNELEWLKIEGIEKTLNEATQNLEENLQKHVNLMEEIENRGSILSNLTNKINALNSELKNKSSVIAEESKKSDFLRKNFNTVNDELDQQSRKYKSLASRKSRIENDITQMEEDIAQQADGNQIQKLKAENEMKLTNFTERKNEIEDIIDNLRRDVEMLGNTIEQIRDVYETEKRKKQNISMQIEKVNQQFRQIEASSGNNLSIYGQHMPRLIERIEQLTKQGKFSKLPRGPLGRYIEVREQKFRDSVENVLSNLLISFMVNTDQDRKMLEKLSKDEFPQSPRLNIITTKFIDKVYDVRDGMVQPVSNAKVLLKLLKINDPIVMNCVIDQSRAESILMVEDEDLATHLTAEEENVPKNLMKIILISPFSEYYPAPLYRSYSMRLRPARYLQRNLADLKKQCQQDLYQLKEKMTAIDLLVQQENDKLNENNNSLLEKKTTFSKLERELNVVKSNIHELRQIEYPPDNEAEILQNELEQMRNNIAEIEIQMIREKKAIKIYEDKVTGSENVLRKSKEVLKSLENESQTIQRNIDDLNKKMYDINKNAMYQDNQVNNLNEAIKESQTEVNVIKIGLAKSIKEATKFGSRVKSTQTLEELLKKIKDAERQISKICSTNENIDDIEKLLEIKSQNHKCNSDLIKIIEKTLFKLKDSRLNRFQKLAKLKQYMSIRIQSVFSRLMKIRDYAGEVIIDHKAQSLMLSVVPRDKNIVNAVSNAKSLSGGERSFSTVAFLLSLWTCIDHPFFFLDEYDVFTDQVNRHIMTKLLINEAMKRTDRQFAFLTPQDMSSIAATDLITIHKMADPTGC